MNTTILATAAVAIAYLIGSIPFAYVVVKAVKGVDIRTVGSGNVGATNAGRLLGLRYFLLVFFLDFLKGLIPTVLFPFVIRAITGHGVMDIAVLIALASIMGHNFPIYLNFHGGKGVSTSLGAAFGLDWPASLAATLVFLASLRANGYVSLSSVLGAAAFVIVYIAYMLILGISPWDREHIALTLLILGLLGMLIVRHRKNWARIFDGTEPRVGRRFRKPPSGRAGVWIVLGIGIFAVGILLALRSTSRQSVDCGDFSLADVSHAKTGHQRAEGLAFANGGQFLGVLCPRYNRLMIYRVTQTPSLELARDIELEGQPVAIQSIAGADRFYVLMRPSGDLRHIHEGYLQCFAMDGRPLGGKIHVGFYPTDFALSPDSSSAFVLTAGRAQGAAEMPAPSLISVDLNAAKVTGSLAFNAQGDDPSRVVLSSSGHAAAVTLKGSNCVAAIDLTVPSVPVLVTRALLLPRSVPYLSMTTNDSILMPVDSDREASLLAIPGRSSMPNPLRGYLISTLPEDSAIEVQKLASSAVVGRLPLRGSANLGGVKPTSVAVSSERGLIAVTNRSGGVHLLAIGVKDQAGTSDAARR